MRLHSLKMPRKRLGQHFLLDPFILGRIVDAAGIEPGDTVVEIGPGLGRMTRMLAERARRVIAIELDEKLCDKLAKELPAESNIELVHADCMKYRYENLEDFKVVANIPYYITTPIVFRLIETGARMESMTLTIQKEVAERIVAAPGGKDYGVLTIAVGVRMQPSMIMTIPAGAFHPPPKVDSAVIRLDRLSTPPVPIHDEELFMRIVRAVFSSRRKTITNGLRSIAPPDAVLKALETAGIPRDIRPERLAIADFARLSNAMFDSPAVKVIN